MSGEGLEHDGTATFGGGGRVGYVAPSTCERMAREFYAVAPPDMAMLIASLPISRLSRDHIDEALQRVRTAATQTVETGAEAVFASGLPLVIKGGLAFDRRLRDDLEQATQKACMTDLGVALAAMESLELEAVLLVTPFVQELNDGIVPILEQAGVHVVADVAMGYDRQNQYGFLPNSAPRAAARELLARHPDADGVYMPCGRVGNVLEITEWEAEFGMPVITCNQMTIWWALQQFDRCTSVSSCGTLLNRQREALVGR